jgi:hypothetical protein
MKTILVINREFRAGGGTLAGKPAAQPGWKLPDQDLTREIARRASVPPEVGARQCVGDDPTVETILNLLNAVNQGGEAGRL